MSKLENFFEFLTNVEGNYKAKCKICCTSSLISTSGKTCSNLTTHLKG